MSLRDKEFGEFGTRIASTQFSALTSCPAMSKKETTLEELLTISVQAGGRS